MGEKGWMSVEVRLAERSRLGDILDLRFAADRLAASSEAGWRVVRSGFGATLACETEHAGRLEDEVRWLEGELARLELPPEAWEAQVHYDSYERPDEDGAKVNLVIANGSIARYEESRLTYSEKEPPFGFRVGPSRSMAVTVAKCLHRGLEVPAGRAGDDFDEACRRVKGMLDEGLDLCDEGTPFYIEVSEDGGSRSRVIAEGAE
ncbi:MAG: hypothetical protein IJ087_06005 [Eggerthellaceae bacterium]|nr:hypothetical protein [Eggerthellaceae bacterium]